MVEATDILTGLGASGSTMEGFEDGWADVWLVVPGAGVNRRNLRHGEFDARNNSVACIIKEKMQLDTNQLTRHLPRQP